MKRFFALLLAVILSVPALCACKGSGSEKLKIVATIFPYYDIARSVAGDKAEVSMLVPAGSETHEYEPTPQDIVDINKADIFIYNGGESDEWVNGILESVDSDVKVLKMFDVADKLYEEDIDGNKGDEYDEHIWTSFSNMKLFTTAISESMQSCDSDNAETYKSSAKSYISDLEKLDGEFRSMIKASTRKTMVVADRFPLLYFVTELGLDRISAFPGCSTETQPSIKTVKRITDFVKDNDIPVVFHMDNTNENLAKSICDETGAEVGVFYSCHNVTKKQFEDGVSYNSLMEINLKSLKEALN